MNPLTFLVALMVAALIQFSSTDLSAVSRITVSANASPEFAQMDADPDKIWFFQIAKGIRFSGGIRDKSLANVSFDDMALIIAKELRSQNMFPHQDKSKGDFILIIHWGSTEVEEDLEDLFPGFFDTAEGEQDIDMVNMMNTWSLSTQRRNIGLIGFDKALYKKNLNPNMEYELRLALKDERYFMTVNAFDYPLFLKTGEAKLLWTTRFSTRSAGTNFERAYVDLTKAAVGYFGKNLEDLERERAGDARGTVEFGEIEVLESDPK
jgi:hypothetical protein